MSLKPEIIGLITNLKDSAVWLKENKDSLIAIGKTVVTLGEVYLKYKIAVGAVNLVNATYGNFMMAYHGLATTELTDIGKKTAAINLQTQSINMMVGALERLVYIQSVSNKIPIAQGIGINNSGFIPSPINRAGAMAESSAVATASGAGIVSTVIAVLGVVAVGVAVAELIKKMPDPFGNASSNNEGWYYDTKTGRPEKIKDNAILKYKTYNQSLGDTRNAGASANVLSDGLIAGDDVIKGLKKTKLANSKDKVDTKAIDSALLGFTKDEVKGNRPQTYNVYIKEMNGNKDCKFELQSLDKMDASAFGRRMADILLSVTNDTQLRNGN